MLKWYYLRSNIFSNHISFNPLLQRFFEKYSNSHILKFFINHQLHRIVSTFILKVIYWLIFKILYRLQLKDVNKSILNYSNYLEQPFLIVQNHCSSRDVILLLAIWAHLGIFTSVLGSSLGFSIKNRLSAIMSHFFEIIPHYGTGESIIMIITKKLLKREIIGLFPEGSQPDGKYANMGLVQEMFTGSARIACNYWKSTGKKLIIQPICSIGANNVFPPRKTSKKIKKTKIIVKFGYPFSLDFSDNADFNEIKEKTQVIALKIAQIWGQKNLIPNYNFQVRRNAFKKSGKYRMYPALD